MGTTTMTAGSLIGFDFWGKPVLSSCESRQNRIEFIFTAAGLNMPSGTLDVADSLVKNVSVSQPAPATVKININCYFPGPWELDQDLGALSRYNVYIKPEPLFSLFAGKVILLDPWIRPQAQGPTGLAEKIVSCDIARRLARLLGGVKARPHFSLFSPAFPILSPVSVRSGYPCQAVLSVAVLHKQIKPRSGFGLLTWPQSEKSIRLGSVLKTNLQAKLPLPLILDGTTTSRLLKELPLPGAVVKAGCISHRIDEGLLRDIDYRQKVAQGIFNALREFFAYG